MSERNQPERHAGDIRRDDELSDETRDFADARVADQLVLILDQYLERLKSGQAVSRESLLRAHPEVAAQLDACLAGIEFLHAAQVAVTRVDSPPGGEADLDQAGAQDRPARPMPSPAPQLQLGDFRLVREVGRGGMGAVFEAEQVSLGRRIALKILRFGPVSDADAIERFRREAETVAKLHHTNIVPIYSVGNQQGVNYYAMQFIEGQSLDRVLQSSIATAGATGLDPRTVAGWGLQAAEALAHAHARQVIHRDVKPSNLILDNEGRIWLTDFGLAKRLDEVTLSLTGALLGTPRYMSPEQADVTRRRVDHRTDLYSLGATLYELVTGRPVFTAETAQAVIGQILTQDPPSPKTIRPSLPVDLNTIIMKCLAKDAKERYQTARDLADDLRALLEERPIRARRPSQIERAAKFWRRQKRSVLLTTSTMAATLCFGLAIMLVWRNYQVSNLAVLSLQTNAPSLTAELLDPSGEVVAGPVSLPTQQPIQLPSGETLVRVSGEGQLSQSLVTSLTPGTSVQFDVDLTDQRLGAERPFDGALRLMRGRVGNISRTWAIALHRAGVTVDELPGSTSTRSLTLPEQVDPAAHDTPTWVRDALGFRWWTAHAASLPHAGYGQFDLRPFVVGQIGEPGSTWRTGRHDSLPVPASAEDDSLRSAPDLNGDGVSDIVIAARHQAWLLALSGADLQPLWFAPRGEELQRPTSDVLVLSATLVPPLVAGDLNGDETSDLIVLWGDANTADASNGAVEGRRWIEAISGANGSVIWQTSLAAEWFRLPQGSDVPETFRWYVREYQGLSRSAGGSSLNDQGVITRSRQTNCERHGKYAFAPDMPILDDGLVRLLAGTRIVHLDARTGEVQAADEPSLVPALPARWAELDGDGHLDLVLVEALGNAAVSAGSAVGAVLPQARIVAWSPVRQQRLWQHTVVARWPSRPDWSVEPPNWPLVADLDRDGTADVVVPDGSSEQIMGQGVLPWGTVSAFEGKTGQRRWSRKIPTMYQFLEHFAVGPDIDQDGSLDVFVASLWGERFELFVDALSGADGSTVWRTRQPLRKPQMDNREFELAPLGWWSDGHDGGALLLIPTAHAQTPEKQIVYGVAASTGQVVRTAREIEELMLTDVDADGNEDLAMVHAPSADNVRGNGGVLRVSRGARAEYWRRLGPTAWPVGDLDRDGVRDLLTKVDAGRLQAFSGRHGRLLWDVHGPETSGYGEAILAGGATPIIPRDPMNHEARLISQRHISADADLNADGHADVVLCTERFLSNSIRPLHAISGATGQLLWTADTSMPQLDSVAALELRELDGHDEPEVILIVAVGAELRVEVFSGRDGGLRWRQSFPAGQGGSQIRSTSPFQRVVIEPSFGDLDGDTIVDLLVTAVGRDSVTATGDAPNTLELHALSGLDGRRLWNYPLVPLRPEWGEDDFGRTLPGVVADLDGDGTGEVVQATLVEANDTHSLQIAAIDGRTGQSQWTWQDGGGYAELGSHHWPFGLRPIVLRGPNQRRWVALLRRQSDGGAGIAVLDDGGQQVAEIDVAPANWTRAAFSQRIWACDVNRDGLDELVFHRPHELVAMHIVTSTVLWRSPLHDDDRVLQLIDSASKASHSVPMQPSSVSAVSSQTSGPTLIVAQQLTQSSIVVLDATTGLARWRVGLPTPGGDATAMGVRVELLTSGSLDLPLLYSSYGNVMLVQAANANLSAFNQNDTQSSLDMIDSMSMSPSQEARRPSGEDPRLVRRLPWAWQPGEFADTMRVYLWMAYWGVTMWIVPVGFASWLIWRRHWTMGTLLTVPVVAAIFLMGATFKSARVAEVNPWGQALLGLCAVPPLASLAVIVYWACAGQWRLIRFWFIVSLGVSVAWAAMQFGLLAAIWPRAASSLPGERYTWEGGYLIWLAGVLITSWVMTPLSLLRMLFGHLNSWRRPCDTI